MVSLTQSTFLCSLSEHRAATNRMFVARTLQHPLVRKSRTAKRRLKKSAYQAGPDLHQSIYRETI